MLPESGANSNLLIDKIAASSRNVVLPHKLMPKGQACSIASQVSFSRLLGLLGVLLAFLDHEHVGLELYILERSSFY